MIDLSLLEPETRARCEQLLKLAEGEGIILDPCQGLRTFAQQDALFAIGRTEMGKDPSPMQPMGRHVTNARAGESWHNFGRAFDVCIRTFSGDKTPKDVWDGPWDRVGELGESLGLIWGGRWKGRKIDRPHFEWHPGLTLAQARDAASPTA